MSRSWKKGETETLISLVQAHPGIWDPTSEDYKKKLSDVWASISKTLGIDKETCRTKWKNLKFQMGKVVRDEPKARSGDAASSKAKPTWCWYDRLGFLKAAIEPNKSSGNFSQLLDDDDDEDIDDGIEVQNDDQSVEESVRAGRNFYKSITSNRDTVDKRAVDGTIKAFVDKTVESNVLLAEIENDDSDSNASQLVYFFKSLLDIVKQLSPADGLYFRIKLKELVMRFAYKKAGIVDMTDFM